MFYVQVLNSDRFQSSESHHSDYKLDASLTIRNLRPEDLGNYRCIAKNSLGDTEGTIMLYELETSTTTRAEDEEEQEEMEDEEDEVTDIVYAEKNNFGQFSPT